MGNNNKNKKRRIKRGIKKGMSILYMNINLIIRCSVESKYNFKSFLYYVRYAHNNITRTRR